MALTDVQKVRLMIGDRESGADNFTLEDGDTAAPLFTDDDINAFLGLYPNADATELLFRAAADLCDSKYALGAQYSIRASVGGTWAHDSRSLGTTFKDLAERYRKIADEGLADFEFAEFNTTVWVQRDIIDVANQRDGLI